MSSADHPRHLEGDGLAEQLLASEERPKHLDIGLRARTDVGFGFGKPTGSPDPPRRLDGHAGSVRCFREREPLLSRTHRHHRRNDGEVITRFEDVLDRRAEAEEVFDELEPVGGVGRFGVVQAPGLELGRVDRAVSHRSRAG